MNEEQGIDRDEVLALQIALERMGINLAVAIREAEFWKIKAQGAAEAKESFMAALREKGVDLEVLFSAESAEDDAELVVDDAVVSAPPIAPKRG